MTNNPYIYLNGTYLPNNTPILTAANRAFRYGDAVFESIALFQQQIPLWALHYERLIVACQILHLALPQHYTADFLAQQIIALAQKNQLSNARIRLTAYRADGGWYAPAGDQAQLLIESTATDKNSFTENNEVYSIGICTEITKSFSALSHLKTAAALPYVLAARYAQQQGWHDALLLNERGEVVEATAANIWLIKNDCAFTPPLTSGCIAGVMRRYLLSHLTDIGLCPVEKTLLTDDLWQADELWLSNATQGIRRIARCDEQQYTRNRALPKFW